ncbi:hypothetical protein B0H19DRAFT_1067818 [Mycena capillaripes]|nr:hypothetical protein B0H19DRAFT_1067818 [Mycena capillaripes]
MHAPDAPLQPLQADIGAGEDAGVQGHVWCTVLLRTGITLLSRASGDAQRRGRAWRGSKATKWQVRSGQETIFQRNSSILSKALGFASSISTCTPDELGHIYSWPTESTSAGDCDEQRTRLSGRRERAGGLRLVFRPKRQGRPGRERAAQSLKKWLLALFKSLSLVTRTTGGRLVPSLILPTLVDLLRTFD